MPWLLAVLLAAALPGTTSPQVAPIPREVFRGWRVGLFIHWGVYSTLMDGEWVMNNRHITAAEYERLPPTFNPSGFDAGEWVRLAKRAGLRYITMTTKHHDGLAMWDSKVTDWDVVDRSPWKRDPIRELADAILRLAGDPAQAESLGREARRFLVEHYSLELAAARVEAVYREVVAR